MCPGYLVQGSSAAVIRQVFRMRIREALVCPKCGTSSPERPGEYEANVFYAHVSALREARQKAPACPFDLALKVALADLVSLSRILASSLGFIVFTSVKGRADGCPDWKLVSVYSVSNCILVRTVNNMKFRAAAY